MVDTTATEPRAVFHYTSQSGLVGIIKDSKVWATSICYMNDAREFNYARQLLHDTVISLVPSDNEPFARLLPFLKPSPSTWDVFPDIFVFSLSEQSDRLGLWRAYAGGTSGYSIGFSTRELTAAAESAGFTLVKCTYDLREQKELISRLIDDTRVWVNSFGASDAHMLEDIGRSFWEAFVILAARIKHPSFIEENEWRLVSKGMTIPKPIDGKELRESKALFSVPREVLLRAGPSTLVPYVEIPLINSEGRLPLYTVRVGPNVDPHRAAHSVNVLLQTSRQSALKGVGLSTIPFRTW